MNIRPQLGLWGFVQVAQPSYAKTEIYRHSGQYLGFDIEFEARVKAESGYSELVAWAYVGPGANRVEIQVESAENFPDTVRLIRTMISGLTNFQGA